MKNMLHTPHKLEMTPFSKLLQTAYAPAYRTTWKEQYSMRVEVADTETFELRDKEPAMVQSPGKGVACFHNPQREKVEIIDFEHFVNQFSQNLKAGQGMKCDFILTPLKHQDFIILNEVSHLWERSLHQFRESENFRGKLDKSFAQLTSSIEKLYHSQEIATRLDKTRRKVALFSIRLRDCSECIHKKGSPLHNLATFLLPTTEQKAIIVEQGLPHGFVYERRFYPNALSLNDAVRH